MALAYLVTLPLAALSGYTLASVVPEELSGARRWAPVAAVSFAALAAAMLLLASAPEGVLQALAGLSFSAAVLVRARQGL